MQINITLERPKLNEIKVTPQSAVVTVNTTMKFIATAYDQYGNPLEGVFIYWTSTNKTVGTVSPALPEYVVTGPDGNATADFTALAPGTTTIIAANITTKINGTATVIVLPELFLNYSNLNVTPTEGVAPLDITACARVENTGGSACEYNATLKINNEVVKFKKGWLGAGENTTVCFNYTLTEAGTYNVTIDELPAKTVVVTKEIHDVYIDTEYTGTYGTGIRIDNETGAIIPPEQNLTVGEIYYIKFKVVNNGTVKPERVNITVEISNGTWEEVLDAYEKEINNYHMGNVSWNTTGLAPGNYTITVNASIPDDVRPEDNERTREVVLTVGNILCYYCCLKGDCCHVSTIELLKAADDWSKSIAPPGFDEPLTTTQLLQLADWWSKNTTTPCG